MKGITGYFCCLAEQDVAKTRFMELVDNHENNEGIAGTGGVGWTYIYI